jgi:hypothetical protein
MGRKDDLIAQAQSMGITLDSTETIADLEAKIDGQIPKEADAAAMAEIEAMVAEAGSSLTPPEPGVYVFDDEGDMHRLPPGEYLVKQGDGVAEIALPPMPEPAPLPAVLDAVPELTIKRAKINRGSRRRIERAMSRFNAEMDAAIKELDMQAFVTDEAGKRTAEWPLVTDMRDMKAHINKMVNGLLAG